MTQRGDVNISAQVAGQQINTGWTAEQAQAPIKALGAQAQAAEKAINAGVHAVTEQAQKVIPGLTAQWPQTQPQRAATH